MRLFLLAALCTAVIARQGQAQELADTSATPGITVATMSGWRVDSTPHKKNRVQYFWAYTVAKDSIVGKYRATYPILKLYCDNDRLKKTVAIQIWTGQFLIGQATNLMQHTGTTHVFVQRDTLPEAEAIWWTQVRDDVMAPLLNDWKESLDALLASHRYHLGVYVDRVGRQGFEFDVTGAATQVAWLKERCGTKQ